MHPNTEECSVSKSPVSTFGALNSTLKGPSGDDKAHPFRSFHKRISPDSRSTHRSYFLESSSLYK